MKNYFWCAVLASMAGQAPAATPGLSNPMVYFGMCDASAAVALDSNTFAVANDEDNPIRIYHADRGGLPIASFDFAKFLRVSPKKPETDIEGGCWLKDKIFWITSHGRNKEGEFRATRHRFFATECQKTARGFQLTPAGRPYGSLLNDFISDPRLQRFELLKASRLAPKSPGGLSIEGLASTPEGHLLIGFRNPIPHNQALLVPLLNPTDLIAGRPARFGEPILLNLDGLGVRDLAWWQDKYVIIAGPYDGRGQCVLYLWAGGKAQPERVPGVDLTDFNAEAAIPYPDGRQMLQLLSDDGTRAIQGVSCKLLRDPNERRFRSIWVTLP